MSYYEKLLLKRKIIIRFTTAFLLSASMLLLMTYFIFLARGNEKKNILQQQAAIEYHDSLNFLIITDNTDLNINNQYAVARINFKDKKLYFFNIPPETSIMFRGTENIVENMYDQEANDTQVRKAVEEDFKIAIDYIIKSNLQIKAKFIDKMQGLAVDMPVQIRDSKGFTIEKGLQTMDGNKVAEILKYQYWSGGKGDEIETQAIIMESMINQYMVPSTYEDLDAIYQEFVNLVETDFSYTAYISIKQPLNALFTEQFPAVRLNFTGEYVKEGDQYKFIPDDDASNMMKQYFM